VTTSRRKVCVIQHLDDRVCVAHVVEEGNVRVDLRNSGKPHRQGRRAEVLEGQLEAVLAFTWITFLFLSSMAVGLNKLVAVRPPWQTLSA
jgi:hypothetical protein